MQRVRRNCCGMGPRPPLLANAARVKNHELSPTSTTLSPILWQHPLGKPPTLVQRPLHPLLPSPGALLEMPPPPDWHHLTQTPKSGTTCQHMCQSWAPWSSTTYSSGPALLIPCPLLTPGLVLRSLSPPTEQKIEATGII